MVYRHIFHATPPKLQAIIIFSIKQLYIKEILAWLFTAAFLWCILIISRHYYVLDICSNFTALSILFFLIVISPYFLSSSAHLPHFYLVLLNFLPLWSVSCSVRFYSKQFFLMWDFCPESEILHTNFDSLLGQDCFSTSGTYCCLFAFTLELDSVAHASHFSGCSHLSPLHLLLGKSESLVIWSSENPYCLPSASP